MCVPVFVVVCLVLSCLVGFVLAPLYQDCWLFWVCLPLSPLVGQSVSQGNHRWNSGWRMLLLCFALLCSVCFE
ncbi:hypothetical protein B0T19DRAFT_417861 [Cercophora scortea]|uniref:Uncharacterized protein n=1 Tax=Cercophora scortea TaxID=314031 RepID=A0AAE0IY23_9PEZI|nr:hypothetical protein B0T19DRAFT_417861 [Cercophora scortea]